MDTIEFWQTTLENRDEIFAMLQKSKLQPRGSAIDKVMCRQKGTTSGFYVGSCYIVSIKQHDLPKSSGWQAGDVIECDINLAGKRITEGSHVLASDDQIAAHLAKHKQREIELKRDIASRRAEDVAKKIASLQG
jgi:hypothetical protein